MTPEIIHLSWGCIELTDGRVFKDLKLWPGGGREWDWRETGTHHVPGIQPADVAELLEHGSEEIVLSRGALLRLRTMPETLELLAARGVSAHVLPTAEAVEKLNQLRRSRPVGGLLHSTC